MKPSPHRGRRGARRAALQALYQWQLTAQTPRDILGQFAEDLDEGQVDDELFRSLVEGVPSCVAELDEALVPLLDRGIAELDPVERAILRIGAFELAHAPAVPWRVVVNEAVELARVFGAESSHRYVNGVLDGLARKVRGSEVDRRPA